VLAARLRQRGSYNSRDCKIRKRLQCALVAFAPIARLELRKPSGFEMPGDGF